ncbi:nucleotidyltransferase family protein [Geminocystis sp. NIES-3709]|uniref:nucleotidyltransferase domain-containing protein n=1 Tax=Geminocystis sp. NIES-3709 TaxID=1617448 RepID=UPI0005FC8DF1|nr:nucleotidyltransferase family protein [Geminocystis sp. NIES-3709]BAQ65280.1 hypothetical protein GM3709_2045 [Geminocystis sp. NIES-3709]
MVFQLKNQVLRQNQKNYLNNQFSPEVQLLLLASRKTLSELNIKTIKLFTSSETINWQELINLATSHSVIPLVVYNLEKYCHENLPNDIKNILKIKFRNNAFKNIYLSKELLEIVQLLKNNNIDCICFKGASLATSIYENISLREFNDIDILIAKKDLLQAKKILLSNGGDFALRLLDNPKKEYIISDRIFIKFAKHLAYTIYWKKKKVEVDLHWQMFCYYFPLSLPIEYLNQSLEEIIIFNEKISTLSPENNLLLLCGHGTKDGWNKLSRICDIAELINYYPQLDWKLLIQEAKNRGALRLVLVGLSLANNLYQISLPDFISLKIINDKKIKYLTDEVEKSLFSECKKSIKKIDHFLFTIQFRERLRDKIKSIVYLLFIPTHAEWALFAPYELPIIFYYLLRPFILLNKFILKFKN